MIYSPRWSTPLLAFVLAAALLGCGGGNNNSVRAPADQPVIPSGAPALLGNTAIDGRNWINFRRSQIGLPALAQNGQVDLAAQGHSNYQKANQTIAHEQTVGKPGFTGVALMDRLTSAGYVFDTSAVSIHGEVISATSDSSGFYMAEELITAIYHRFVIFEPKFKEIGTGAATVPGGYTYFTSDFTANGGYGPGIGRGNIAPYPFAGQSDVPAIFYSDYESPDPVASQNAVGYPISVHADIDTVLTVQSFTVRPRGSSELATQLLTNADKITPRSAVAIIPLAVLRARTTYDVAFAGSAGGTPVSRTWSFTTK